MPGGDRTGPTGMGPMTGRAAGYCAGYSSPGFMNPGGCGFGFGRGMGFGFRGGRGMRRGFYGYGAAFGVPYGPALSRQQEVEMLRGQAKSLEENLAEINKRIGELENDNSEA